MITILLAATVSYEIQGEGFFRFETESGIVYSRKANLQVANGFIVNADGLRLSPPVRATGEWSIEPDGSIVSDSKVIGELVLARFNGAKSFLGSAGKEGFGVISLSRRLIPSGTSAAQIAVRQLTEITKSEILLEDIADISASNKEQLAKLSLGEAPNIGEQKLITLAGIRGALRSAKINPETINVSMPAKAIVTRIGNKVTAAQLEAFARNWISQNVPNAGALTLTSNTLDKRIPEGDLQLKVANNRNLGNAIVVNLEGLVDGKHAFLTQLVFNAAATASGSAGGIKAGQTVRVILLSNALTVETAGKAQNSAAVGGNITVLIDDTKATVVGIVKPDGTIEVKL